VLNTEKYHLILESAFVIADIPDPDMMDPGFVEPNQGSID